MIKIQLASDQLRIARGVVFSQGVSISEVLPRVAPDVQIAIIMGYAPATQTEYVKDAFFNVDQARQAMDAIVREAGATDPPNESPTSHTFSIAEGTIRDLDELLMCNPVTNTRISDVQRLMAYALLKKKLYAY